MNSQLTGAFFIAGKKGTATTERIVIAMNAEAKKRYFQELTLNLRHEGFTVKPETEDGLLPVELNGRRLCLALDTGGVRYRREDVSGDVRSEALEQVIDIAKITGEYMSQMETAPQLTAASLEGDYRLLTDFNGVVLAGHPTQFGVQFITWERVQNRTALHQGNYYGPSDGAGSYTAAKQGFAVRSGLIPRSALFTQEQLAETYRCIRETLESACPITDERQKCLESAAEQIEHGVPDLAARAALSNQREMELTAMESPQDSGMQFS